MPNCEICGNPMLELELDPVDGVDFGKARFFHRTCREAVERAIAKDADAEVPILPFIYEATVTVERRAPYPTALPWPFEFITAWRYDEGIELTRAHVESHAESLPKAFPDLSVRLGDVWNRAAEVAGIAEEDL